MVERGPFSGTGLASFRSPVIFSIRARCEGRIRPPERDPPQKLEASKVKESLAKVGEKAEPVAPLVYFCYLELPVTAEVLDVDDLLKGVANGTAASAS